MKAIKDCEWEVYFFKGYLLEGSFTVCWIMHFNKISGVRAIHSEKSFKSVKLAKHNWERFAKLNGIKKWKYV